MSDSLLLSVDIYTPLAEVHGKTGLSTGTPAPASQSAVFFYFIYLVLAVLGPHCDTGFSLVVASRGYSPVAVYDLLIEVASLVGEHRLQGTQASVGPVPRI